MDEGERDNRYDWLLWELELLAWRKGGREEGDGE
ncbi:hypothetical protein Rrhod_1120 [Rhodococcus rhodnii LMG 5362]|uniref:Uncharacterized protein n=1 Tax=Rhodococcus rhodnii LMG 5362 TaxID=1273125 RepID=R7WQ64_9NOCA|nr:hypothetical protein Rrhod_4039 [Rhodococcus rhodnii LMG 5362]EOM77443.1 hypothetical protein Rrhod_1120 [Rhodococcus rhodnii LMG 5362]